MENKKYVKPTLESFESRIEDVLLVSMVDGDNDIFDYDAEL